MQEPVIPRQHAAVERARANPPLRALTHRPVLPAYQVEKRYDRAGVEVSPRCYLWTEEILADHPRSVWSRRKKQVGHHRVRKQVGEDEALPGLKSYWMQPIRLSVQPFVAANIGGTYQAPVQRIAPRVVRTFNDGLKLARALAELRAAVAADVVERS